MRNINGKLSTAVRAFKFCCFVPQIDHRFCLATLPKDNIMNVFDRSAKLRHRDLVTKYEDREKYDYLKDETGYRLADRVFDIKRDFDKVVELGCGRGYIVQHLTDNDARTNDSIKVTKRVVDEEFDLPFETNSVSLVISNLSFHWVNNLPGAFREVYRILRPDGVFLASLCGAGTLFELRSAIQVAETELEGGFGIHVSPFVEPPDIGDLLRNAGFNMTTIDTDEIVVGYPSMFELMHDLKAMGENNCAWKRKTHLHRKTQQAAAAKYKEMYGKEDGSIPATFSIISFIAWKPHDSQPKPAKRGSQNASFKDIGNIKVDSPQKTSTGEDNR